MKLAPCMWQGCLFRSDDALLDVTLVYAGNQFVKPRVELCSKHMREAKRTGMVTLRPEVLLA